MKNGNKFLESGKVSIVNGKKYFYGKIPPFNPDKKYPEFKNIKNLKIDPRNTAYGAVREAFFLLGLDKKNYGKEYWNPLGEIVAPGEKVVIKPNAVSAENFNKEDSWETVITHGAIIRTIIDYVYLALKGKGEIIVADAPLAHANFLDWKAITGIDEIKRYYQKYFNFNVQVYDLRQLYVPRSKLGFAISTNREVKDRDPLGYAISDLKENSAFSDIPEEKIKLFYGSDYNRLETIKHHLGGKHEYLVSKTILAADTIISLPKLKTHKKVGTTLNIKGMVGIIGDKNYIPHHLVGDPSRGGDEYPDSGKIKNLLNRYRMFLITRFLSRKIIIYDFLYFFGNLFYHLVKKTIYFFERLGWINRNLPLLNGGSWPGNDTACRMAIDLMVIGLYCDKEGKLKNKVQRKFFSLIDGIVGGELEGPLSPSRKESGTIIAGFNPLAVDIVATRFMGFDPLKIKMYFHGINEQKLNKFGKIIVLSKNKKYLNLFNSKEKYLDFRPPRSWEGQVEIDKNETKK